MNPELLVQFVQLIAVPVLGLIGKLLHNKAKENEARAVIQDANMKALVEAISKNNELITKTADKFDKFNLEFATLKGKIGG